MFVRSVAARLDSDRPCLILRPSYGHTYNWKLDRSREARESNDTNKAGKVISHMEREELLNLLSVLS